MRIFKDITKGVLIIETHPRTYPLGSLTVSFVDGKARLTDANGLVVVAAPLARIQDQNGDAFATGQEVLTYLENEIKTIYVTETGLTEAIDDHVAEYHPLFRDLPIC